MSVFGDIMSAIFGSKAKAAAPASPSATSLSAASPSAAPSAPGTVDVAAILDKATKEKKQKLYWRKSIVDLMKVLDLDSSLAARQQLAKELKYTGDMKKSAPMNVWLHKQVMVKLAENGGKVPDELKH
jgi:hypothetical protein